MVALKVVHFSTHHIFEPVQDKMKRVSPKCSKDYVAVYMQLLNILRKLVSVLLHPKTLLPAVQLLIFFGFSYMLNIM